MVKETSLEPATNKNDNRSIWSKEHHHNQQKQLMESNSWQCKALFGSQLESTAQVTSTLATVEVET